MLKGAREWKGKSTQGSGESRHIMLVPFEQQRSHSACSKIAHVGEARV